MNPKASPPDRRILLDSIRDYIEQLREEGMDGLPLGSLRRQAAPSVLRNGETAVNPIALRAPSASLPAPGVRSTAAAQTGEMISRYPGLERTTTLEVLRDFIGDCRRCKLCENRTNLVFGVGDPRAELMFVGEGPGADEDVRGEPFVGRAGQLLTDIIERAMGMKRSEVYICNVVKCRPPGNRNPEPEEVAACEPFLFRQIEIVRPRAIVALGTFAVQSLLKVKTPISRLRGVWHEVRGTRMMPTFHPAYLLRNPADKRLVWQDIQEVMKLLGRPLPGRGGR